MALGLVLVGGAWNSAAAGLVLDMSKITSLCVMVERLSTFARRDHNLSKKEIQNHIYVWLKAKLPRVQVSVSVVGMKGFVQPDCQA